MKVILSLILLALFQIQLSDMIHKLGRDLCLLENVPHRGLGMLYTATLLQPHRIDFQEDYFAEYVIATHEKHISEGTKKPIMAFQMIQYAKLNPENRKLKLISDFCQVMEKDKKEASK